MSKKRHKKSSENPTYKIVFATAILNLIKSIIDLLN